MSSGLLGLLDDVAALAKLAAASIDDVGAAAGRASVKAAGVVVDDTAVTPAYVHGLAADRELPIIKRIAKGSLKNKLLYIIPVALVLSEFVPVLVEIVLMVGGAYLCFEGAEKIHHRLAHHDDDDDHDAAGQRRSARSRRRQTVAGAIRTDFILSGEIIVIALKDVLDQGFVSRAIILVIVAVVITAVVYGVVALIVKMDDVGLRMAQSRQPRRPSGSGAGWSPACPSCWPGCRSSAPRRCCGSAGTSCSSAPTSSAGTGPTTSCTASRTRVARRARHRRRPRRGSSTRWRRPSSGSPSAPSSWRSCRGCASADASEPADGHD